MAAISSPRREPANKWFFLPIVEVAAKFADALTVTIDYLVKDGEYKNIDNEALTRLKLIEKLPKEEREHLVATMDAFFTKHKL